MASTPANTFFNVLDYRAAGDGNTDDTGAIRTAIKAAASAAQAIGTTGNVVFFPAGMYYLEQQQKPPSGLTVPYGVTLAGAGWCSTGTDTSLDGSWIVTDADANFGPVTISENGGAVRNLAFNVRGQDKTTGPAGDYPTIHIMNADCTLVEDVFLRNPYCGIYIDGSGQVTVRRVFGQPLQYGIKIDGSEDTNYIDSLHFWTFWQQVGKGNQTAYQLKEGVALDLRHCDNPHISNVFAYNYNKGLSLSQSTAPGASTVDAPHKVHLINADFDCCISGIWIDAPGGDPAQGQTATSIQLANVTTQAPTESAGLSGPGLMVTDRSAYTMVQASNMRVSNSVLNAIEIDAESAVFWGENIFLLNWRSGAGICLSQTSARAFLGVGFYAIPGNAKPPLKTYQGRKGQFQLAATTDPLSP